MSAKQEQPVYDSAAWTGRTPRPRMEVHAFTIIVDLTAIAQSLEQRVTGEQER